MSVVFRQCSKAGGGTAVGLDCR